MTDRPLRTAEACELLGVSRPTLRRLLLRAEDPVPYYHVGAHRRFDREELLAWRRRETHRALCMARRDARRKEDRPKTRRRTVKTF